MGELGGRTRIGGREREEGENRKGHLVNVLCKFPVRFSEVMSILSLNIKNNFLYTSGQLVV